MQEIREIIHAALFQTDLIPDAGSPSQELLPDCEEETRESPHGY